MQPKSKVNDLISIICVTIIYGNGKKIGTVEGSVHAAEQTLVESMASSDPAI